MRRVTRKASCTDVSRQKRFHCTTWRTSFSLRQPNGTNPALTKLCDASWMAIAIRNFIRRRKEHSALTPEEIIAHQERQERLTMRTRAAVPPFLEPEQKLRRLFHPLN